MTPERFSFVTHCQIGKSNRQGLVISFTEHRNITIPLEEGIRLLDALLRVMGNRGHIWTRVTKIGIGGDSIGPPEKGVGIMSIECPFLGDQQVTLNLISTDGVVVWCKLCHNGFERNAWTEAAKSFL